MSESNDKSFFAKLREDMFHTRGRRFQYQLAKVTSIGSLMGASALVGQNHIVALFYYIIPFVAIAFDLFILGESFTLRRLAAFIRHQKARAYDSEVEWERFVKRNADILASLANLIITVSCAVGCSLILILASSKPTDWFSNGLNICWLCSVFFLILVLRMTEARAVRRTWSFDEEAPVG
jgi:drug/metabolite transporter (DMT)-like permease